MNRITAPFTPEQVAGLNAWQNCDWVHGFTCGNDRVDADHIAYQAKHGGDLGQLVATEQGWLCPVCGYTQNWAHEFMANGTPPHPFAYQTKINSKINS